MLAENIQCPSCWEMIEVLVDPSVPEQQYVEDCSVCCRPLVLTVTVHDDHADIDVVRESD